MNSPLRALAGAAVLAALLGSPRTAGAGQSPADAARERLSRERVAELEKIREEGTAAENVKLLLAYLRTGPNEPVRIRSGKLLAKVKTEDT